MKWLDRTLFRSPYHIGLCTSEKAFKRELKRLGVPKDQRPPFISEGAHATTHTFENTAKHGLAAIVCMRRNKGVSLADHHSMLVHEAVHVWQKVRTFIGERSPGDEFEAYSVQFISYVLFEAFADM